MARRGRTGQVRAVPTRVAMLALGLGFALAGCAGSNASREAASGSTEAPHLAFHEPRTPRDAAYEYVQALAHDRTDLTQHLAGGLACGDRLEIGSWPLAYTSADTDPQMHFHVRRVRPTGPSAWRVTVDVLVGDNTPGFHVDTTVVSSASRYRVCSAESS